MKISNNSVTPIFGLLARHYQLSFSLRSSTVMLIGLSGLMLAACATNNTAAEPPASAAETSQADQPLETLSPEVAATLGLSGQQTDAEVIEHILAGEFLGGQGDLRGAAQEYAQAASLSNDAEVADRATRVALQAQAWEQVKQTAGRWLTLSPDHHEALQALAIAQLELNEQAGASDTLGRLILASEPRSRGWQQAGSVLANTDNKALADKVLLSLVNSDQLGDSADGLYGQSVLAWRLGDLERAKTLALQASMETRRLDILEWAAQIAFAAGDVEAAIATYTRALEVVPGDRDLTLALAEILKRDGQTEAALQALRGLGNNTEALYTRAAYQLEAGNRAEAEALYLQLRELTVIPVGQAAIAQQADPSIAHSLQQNDNPAIVHAFYTAQLAEQLDYREQALEWYVQADGGEYAMPATMRAAALLAELDRMPEAQALLQPLQNSDDEDTVVNAFIAESSLLQEAGLADQAVQRLTVALGRISSSTELLYARALAAATDNDVDLAEQDLRRIIREDPDNAAALNALGYTLADLTQRYDEALPLIEKALRLNPDDAATLDSMGWVKYRMGELDAAVEYLRRAYALDDNPEIGAHLGEVLWSSGAQQEAREIWRQAVADDPQHGVLNDTLERLGVVL